MAEFPDPDLARRVLEAVGAGERTHANIAAAAGGRHGPVASGALSPILQRLIDQKRAIAIDQHLSTRSSRPSLYRVADSNLRLYLAILRDVQELARRGLGTVGFQTFLRRWHAWRGKAVEPLVRESLRQAAARAMLPWDGVGAVGGWWNRRFNPEVDLVGADSAPAARNLYFVGSIKWLERPFDRDHLIELPRGAAEIPGYTPGSTGLAAVTLSGVASGVDELDLVWGPGDIVSAWGAA